MWSGAGRGWTPAFAFPTHRPASKHRGPRPAPGCTEVPGPHSRCWGEAWGGQMARLPRHQLPGATVKEPLQMGGPQRRGLGGGLDKCSEVSRCYRGQRAELLVTEHPPLTSCPGPVSHARGDVCVCPSRSLKAMPGLILSWPRQNLPMAGVQHPCPSGPLRWWRVPVALLGRRA